MDAAASGGAHGAPTWSSESASRTSGGGRGAALVETLRNAEAALGQTEPVHVHDLKETAAKKTQELLEKDRLILHYKVYTMEGVENSQIERERARVMDFFYRIGEGTLHVYEASTPNSGLWQGDYAKRHIPFKPDGSGVYGPTDFTIGAEIWVSGRAFTIVDADARTRELLAERYGMLLDDPISIPESFVPVAGAPVGHHPHLNKVMCDVGDMEDPQRGFYKKAPDTKGKFLEHGPAMLRFEAEWRETSEPFGDRRSFAVQYYLADDTMEVLDKSSPHSRGGQFTKFVTRQRVPRLPLENGTENVVPIKGGALGTANAMGKPDSSLVVVPDAGLVMSMSAQARRAYKYTSGPTVWFNATSPITGAPSYQPVTGRGVRPSTAAGNGGASSSSLSSTLPGPMTVRGFPVLSSLVSNPDFLTAADLICGGVVSIYGRPLLLKTCDPFTVAFGLQKLGVDQRRCFIMDAGTIASERAAVAPHLVPRGTVPLAPHIGVAALGSEEETRINAKKIVPTFRASRDADKLYQLSGKCLRFEAKMDPTTCTPDEARREFVVTLYLEDDTMAIVEVMRDRKGASAVRWLSRGKHRNADGEPDAAETAAVLGNRPGVTLAPDTQAAYDRVFAGSGDRFGYGDGFAGQGYTGGIFGKADRVGPGGTGVPSRTDVGIRDPLTHAYTAPRRFFRPSDFHVGAHIRFEHAPGQAFVLTRPDGFTAEYLAAREEQSADDARDVYVADNRNPVPSLPLESGGRPSGGDISQDGSFVSEDVVVSIDGREERLPAAVHDGALCLAKLLAGVAASAQSVVRQSDKSDRGVAPVSVVTSALASYGCRPPACPTSVIESVVEYFVVGTASEVAEARQAVENARAKKHGFHGSATSARPKTPSSSYSAPGGGSPSAAASRSASLTGAGTVATIDNPLHGAHLNDFLGDEFANAPVVDYVRLFSAIRAVAERQQVLQPRLDKILSQLRMALLSSRTHLRRVFRELDTAGTGVITFGEFRRMLLRHHLDIGMSDAQVRAIMSRFPAAPAPVGAFGSTGRGGLTEPAISWQGFIEVILDAQTLAPGEVEQFVDFVRGVRDTAPDGVGGTRVWPEVYPHVNTVTSWAPNMDLSRFDLKGADARPMTTARAPASMGASAPPPRAAMSSSSSSSGVVAPRPSTAAGSGAYSSSSRGPATARASTTLSVGGAPELPNARPRTAPAGAADPRPTPARPVLDVIEALSSTERGQRVLARMRDAFGTRKTELFRTLSLYDTGRRHALTASSFVAALGSAGLQLSTTQAAELCKDICILAADGGAVPAAGDVLVDYNSFLDNLYA